MPRKRTLPLPLARTPWVWPEGYCDLVNHFAQFRRDFQLDRVPGKAKLFITADAKYKLWVNGSYVCRGPARGYQSHWPFDEVDLTGFLRPGANWVSVEAYNPGISTFQYLHQAEAGLLCAPADGPLAEAWAKSTWAMRRSPAHRRDTARFSIQLDFQEHADARRDDRGWIVSPRPPTDWVPRIFPPRGHNRLQFPFGQPPYDTVEPRGIPMLREEVVAPTKVTAHAVGRSDADWRVRPNVSWGWVGECRKLAAWGDGSEVTATGDEHWLTLTIPPTDPGDFRAVTVDVGRIVVGNLMLRAEGAAGGEVLDFQHDQCLRTGRPDPIEPGVGCNIATANRLTLRPGRTDHEFFHPLGFRHVTLIVREATVPITLRLAVRTVGYPFTLRGEFACSDAMLNDIHAACRATQQVCSLDVYVDTPWREQAQWWGDARVQACNTFYLDGDARLLARGIRSIAEQPMESGLTPGHAPTSGRWCVLPDFSLTWVLTIYDHYWQTGDPRMLQEQWSRVRRVLRYFDGPNARHASGLLRHDRRLWYFGDWSDLCKDEVPTLLNMWYLVTLGKLAENLDAAGKGRDAAAIREAEARHRELVVSKLFDPATGLFVAGLNHKLEPVGRPGVHDQTCALMLNLCPEAHVGMIQRRLLPYLLGQTVEGALPSAFWSAYVIENMGRRGYAAEAIAFIRRRWEPMLSTGTTWEGFEWTETAGGSCTHAWSAHPSYHLVNILAGLRQTAPGWTGVSFAPAFVQGIDRVQARVPSPRGDIDARWQRQGDRVVGELSVPEGVAVDCRLPGREASTLRAGTHRFECPA